MSLQDEAGRGRLEGLVALRDLLAGQLEVAEPRETAALARALRDVLRDVEELERRQPKGSIVDELRDRKQRKARGAGAAGVAAPGGGAAKSG